MAQPEITDVTFADVGSGGFAGGDYFTINRPSKSHYVWFDVDNGSTDPGTDTGTNTDLAGITGNGIEVDLTTDISDEAVQVKDAAKSAINAASDGYTAADAPAAGDGAEETSEIDCDGVPASSFAGGEHFWIYKPGPVEYYVWPNVDALSVDPTPSSLQGYTDPPTGLELVLSGSDTDTDVAIALASLLDGTSGFSASRSGDVVTVVCDDEGSVPNTQDSSTPTGFGFSTTVQGATDSNIAKLRITNDSDGAVTDAADGVGSPTGFTISVVQQGQDAAAAVPVFNHHYASRRA